MSNPIDLIGNACTIDLANPSQYVNIQTVQGDNSRYITVALTYNGVKYSIPENSKIIIQGTKPDGKEIIDTCQKISENEVKIDISSQMSLVAGQCVYNVGIYGEVQGAGFYCLKSFRIQVNVQKAAYSMDYIASTDEFNTLSTLIIGSENVITKAREWAVGPSGSGTEDPSDINNSYYYATMSRDFQEKASSNEYNSLLNYNKGLETLEAIKYMIYGCEFKLDYETGELMYTAQTENPVYYFKVDDNPESNTFGNLIWTPGTFADNLRIVPVLNPETGEYDWTEYHDVDGVKF